MASWRESVTVTELETYSQYDYSSIDPSYVDVYIEAQITAGEEFVEGFTGETLSSSTTGALKLAVKVIADRRMKNQLIKDGHLDLQPINVYDDTIILLLKNWMEMNFQASMYEGDDSEL